MQERLDYKKFIPNDKRIVFDTDRGEVSFVPNESIAIRSTGLRHVHPHLAGLATMEMPKQGARISADVCEYWYHGESLICFVGDGINIVGKVPDKLDPILKKYDCQDRPDALFRRIIQSHEFNETLHDYFGGSHLIDPRSFLYFLNNYAQLQYLKLNINLDNVDSFELPSIVGTCAVLDDKYVSLAAIGDPVNYYIDVTGELNLVSPVQNHGFDKMTQAIINHKLSDRNYPTTVSEITRSPDFLSWIRYSYNVKMNFPGIVTSIDAKYFTGEYLYTQFPLTWISELILGTDGLILGTKKGDERDRLKTLYGPSGASSNYSHLEMIEYMKGLRRKQIAGFSETECSQEKKTDDVALIVIKTDYPQQGDLLFARYFMQK